MSDKSVPRHIAVIMDGNGRWAKKRFMPRTLGHREGVKATRRAVEACSKNKVEALTLFAFSSENWRRPEEEVGLLMKLFLVTLRGEVKRLHRNKVKVRFIGDKSPFNATLREEMEAAEKRTANNSGMYLNIAVNYGGRWDIAHAAKRLCQDVEAGKVTAAEVDEALFGCYVDLSDLPEPDLFIRTGGERRISNYLLWQLAYTELYFTDALWPDFDENTLDEALVFYAQRQRRFGRTGEQVG